MMMYVRVGWVCVWFGLVCGCAHGGDVRDMSWERWTRVSPTPVPVSSKTRDLQVLPQEVLEVVHRALHVRASGASRTLEKKIEEAYAQSDGWNVELRLGNPSTRVFDDSRRMDVRASVRWKPEKPQMDRVRQWDGRARVWSLRARDQERRGRVAEAVSKVLLTALADTKHADLLEARAARCTDVVRRLKSLTEEGASGLSALVEEERRCAGVRRSLVRVQSRVKRAKRDLLWWLGSDENDEDVLTLKGSFGDVQRSDLADPQRALRGDSRLSALRAEFESLRAKWLREETRSRAWVSFVELSGRGQLERGEEDDAWAEMVVAFDLGLGGDASKTVKIDLELLRERTAQEVARIEHDVKMSAERVRLATRDYEDAQDALAVRRKEVEEWIVRGRSRGALEVREVWSMERSLWGLEDEVHTLWIARQEALIVFGLRAGVWSEDEVQGE